MQFRERFHKTYMRADEESSLQHMAECNLPNKLKSSTHFNWRLHKLNLDRLKCVAGERTHTTNIYVESEAQL